MSNPSAYTIRISEEQRSSLLAVLKANNLGTNVNPDDEPLGYWQSMLEELPKAEAEDPGCLHGFCL